MGGWGEEPTYSTAYLQPRKVEIDTSQMTAKYGYSLSFISPGCLLPSSSVKCDSMSFLSFTMSVKRSHSPFTRMHGVVILVEVISNRFVSPVFNVSMVFFEAGVKGVSSFTDVELSAFGVMNDVYNVVRQAVELLRDVHLGLSSVTLVLV